MDSSSAAPLSDVKVFKEYPSRNSALPQRNIYNVEIVDGQSGIPQVLDSLQRSGPLHFKGWVPIEETKHASAKDSGKFVYIFGEIIEWTHQYDPERPKRPIFWLKSYGSITPTYEPYFAPLVKVCSYLDVLVQLVVEMRMKDDLHVLIPQVAVLLAEPESMVSRMIQRHRKQLLELGASDSIIRESNFYKTWVAEQASDPAGPSGNIRASNSPEVFSHAEYETFTDDMRTNTDSEIDAGNNHDTYSHSHSVADDTDNSDSNATPPPPPQAASKPLLPIVSYDIVDRGVIPELETKEETYEELPAPCGDDFCYLHPVFKDVARNAIGDDMQLLSNKFEPWRSRILSSQLDPAVKVEPGLELYSGLREESHTSGSWSVSDPGSFFCPVQGCLITICNTTIPTSKEFIATVSQHIGTHNLSEGDTERVLRDYLAKPWKKPTRPKAWDVTAKQLNGQRPSSTNPRIYNDYKSLDTKESNISSHDTEHSIIFIHIVTTVYTSASPAASSFNEFSGTILGVHRSSIINHVLPPSCQRYFSLRLRKQSDIHHSKCNFHLNAYCQRQEESES
ncbi:hypothetical protein BGZ96_002616 [Linnemannia gamsii]|uniref:Uncharacterized protein n=1 Tax=Linnemannia gamsii TaxID=64522 RepID=A0ABQ7KFE8_9FUNG|nr:hypothetical protein BGZ96_002616 [Linnemannia gamsii]